MDYHAIARSGTRRDDSKTVTILASHMEYETESRHYGRIRNLLPPAESGSGSDDSVTRFLHALEPFAALSVDSFLQLLAKVKGPKPASTRMSKKSLEEVERERREKENKKLEALRVKAEQKANAEAENDGRRNWRLKRSSLLKSRRNRRESSNCGRNVSLRTRPCAMRSTN